MGRRRAAGSRDLFGDNRCVAKIARGDCNRRAGCREGKGDPTADPAACSRDEGDLAAERERWQVIRLHARIVARRL